MGKSRRTPPKASPTVGGGGAWRPSWGYIAMALVFAIGCIGFLAMSPSSPLSTTDTVVSATDSSAPFSMAAPSANEEAGTWPIQATVPLPKEHPMAPDTRPTHEGDNDPTPDLSSYVPRGAKPTMNEVIARLHEAGVETGLGAFNPPGTRPPVVGLAVPENFVLPEGYVRHHQATDDGQRIEAILMFAPDRPIFDANHQPIAVPANRVVPPEQAPAGLPIRKIVIPAPLDSGSTGL